MPCVVRCCPSQSRRWASTLRRYEVSSTRRGLGQQPYLIVLWVGEAASVGEILSSKGLRRSRQMQLCILGPIRGHVTTPRADGCGTCRDGRCGIASRASPSARHGDLQREAHRSTDMVADHVCRCAHRRLTQRCHRLRHSSVALAMRAATAGVQDLECIRILPRRSGTSPHSRGIEKCDPVVDQQPGPPNSDTTYGTAG